MIRERRRSTLGFVLDRLNVQTVSLSRRLHVDASLISKWKSGDRCFNSKSIYYEEVIRFLIEESKKSDHRILKKALSEVFPMEAMDKVDSPEPYLRQLLSSCHFALLDQETMGMNEEQEMSRIHTLQNNEGRRQAVDRLLSIAEKLSSPGEILFIDSEEYQWLLQDAHFADEFVQRMNQLLKDGFQVKFVIHFSSHRESFVRFFETCNILLFHRNAHWYYYEDYDATIFNFSFAILEKAVSILGLSANENDSTTMIFTDAKSVMDHGSLAGSIIKRCHKLFISFPPEKCKDVVEYVTAIQNRGALYAYLPAPAFISARTELLQEILRDNQIDAEVAEQCVRVNELMRNLRKIQFHCLEDRPERIIQILQLEEMERRVKSGPFISCSLTLLGGKHVMVSRSQYARCIRHLAEALEHRDNLQIAFLSEKDHVPLPSIPEMNCWCKQNTWMVQMDQQGFRLSDDGSIVNAASITLERCLRKIPPERKEKEAVIAYLRYFADELEQDNSI